MTIETITRGDAWWKICYGFGRLQRARAAFILHQPDAVKRAQIMNPDITFEELRAQEKITTDDIAGYTAQLGPEIARIVLHSASDWDGNDIITYVDETLPEDVGNEILVRIRKVLEGSTLSNEVKKN